MPWTVEALLARSASSTPIAPKPIPARTPISRARQRAEARRPAISAPKIRPSARKHSDLPDGETPPPSSRPSTIATRGMGEATRRSKKPPSISSAVAIPAVDAAEQQRLRDRGGELEVQEAVDSREARQRRSCAAARRC